MSTEARTSTDLTGHSPARKTVLIESDESVLRIDLRELWRYRELLYFLTWRDVKIRYKQTLIGAAWAIVQPLFAMLLFTFVFSRLAHIATGDVPYPLFAYAGLLPWTFFANALNNSGNSLLQSKILITKVYFPRMLIPAASIFAGLLDFAIGCVLLIPLLLYYHIGLTWRILLLPVFGLLTTVLAVGVGACLAAINVKYRDVRYALPFIVQLWLFASPVIYPAMIVPARWHLLLALNPMTGIIEGFRASLLGQPFDVQQATIAGGLTLIVLLASLFIFGRMEEHFADII